VLAAALGRRKSVGVAARPVVQQGRGPLDHAETHAFASRRCLEPSGLDQLEGVGLVAAPCGKHQRRVLQRCHFGRLRDCVGFLDERGGRGEFASMNVEGCAIGSRDREHAEGAGLSREA
jgi:hypothetical protein